MHKVRSTIQIGEPSPLYGKVCVPPCPSQQFRYKLERVSIDEPFPRTIHQLWKTERIPAEYENAVKSCKRLNPTWEYRLWTDEAIDKFIAWEYPFFYEAYKSYPYQIQRVDAARYFILLHHGGVTIDIDLECRTALDVILANKTSHDLVVPETDPGGVTVEFMAAKPGRPFLLHVAMDLYSNMANYVLPYVTIIFTTGPMYLTNRMVDYPKNDEIYVIPQELYRTKYFRNLHGGSWHRWDSVLIKSLYTLTSPFVSVPIVFILIFIAYRRWKTCDAAPVKRLCETCLDV
jgi:mannosyltransferase OCH1-like enzyme